MIIKEMVILDSDDGADRENKECSRSAAKGYFFLIGNESAEFLLSGIIIFNMWIFYPSVYLTEMTRVGIVISYQKFSSGAWICEFSVLVTG